MNATWRLYRTYLRLKRECAAYVRANDARIVGDAMNRLNRVAYNDLGRARKEPIYALKNALVKLWYQRGYAQGVQLQTQTQTCWRCGGSGDEPYEPHREVADGVYEDWCLKCQGTGIWRQHRLYAFDFAVDGKCYRWHQPKSLVSWDVIPTCEITTEYKRYTPPEEVGEVIDLTNSAEVEADYCTVLEYLRWQGVPSAELRELMTARQVITVLWKASAWNRRWRRLTRWAKRLRARNVDWVDIPF